MHKHSFPSNGANTTIESSSELPMIVPSERVLGPPRAAAERDLRGRRCGRRGADPIWQNRDRPEGYLFGWWLCSNMMVFCWLVLFLTGCKNPPPEVEPGEPVLRRLTSEQYGNSLRDLIGADIFVPEQLEPDLEVRGFLAIGTAENSVSPRGVEQYENAAYIIAEQAMSTDRRAGLVPCTPTATVDTTCAEQFVRTFGRRAWRRPLSAEEVSALVATSDSAAAALGDFYDGLEFAVARMLQSPNFLYRIELGEPDPNQSGRLRYTNYEMASRLSYFLWNSMPDDELLDAAERGELTDSVLLESRLSNMLQSERARAGLRAYVDDVLHLYRLERLAKEPSVFVHMTDTLGPSAREETLLLWEYLAFDEQADMRDLMTIRTTFLNRELATLYDVPAPVRDGFGQTDLPDDRPRQGLLGHASLLASQAHPVSSSPTLRGKFIRQVLLCADIPDPPSNVDTSIPEPSADAPTLRDRVAAHLEVESCAVCHEFMDPIGLGLENFDGIGRYRTTENGVTIDASGELDGVTFDGPEGLSEAIRNHPDFVPCMVKNMYRYASGHWDRPGERPALRWLAEEYARNGHRMEPLLIDMLSNPLFRQTGAIEP